jgi:SAM-dependent methyltransferase
LNGPKNNTISGDEVKVDALKLLLDVDKVFARKLNVSNAYHSSHTKEVSDEYLELLGDLSFGTPLPSTNVYMFSSVTGVKVDQDHLSAQYWVDNLISPVRFTDALLSTCFTKLSKGQASLRVNAAAENIFVDTIIEIGPHAALQSAIKETIATKTTSSTVTYLHVLNRTAPGLTTIINTAGFLISRGAPINVLAVNNATKTANRAPKLLVQLPSYSFHHADIICNESRLSKNYRLRKFPRHDLFGAPVADWNAEAPKWRNFIRLSEQPWLRHHIVTDAFVYPGVGYLIAVIEASRQIADPKQKISGFQLRDISLKRALIIPDDKKGVETSLAFTRMDESSMWASSTWNKFQFSSYNPVGDDWIEHCTGYVAVEYETTPGLIDQGREEEQESLRWQNLLTGVLNNCIVPVDMNNTYENIVTAGLNFGELFKNLSDVKGRSGFAGEVTGIVTVPDVRKAMPANFTHSHLIHPTTMDSMMHLFLAAIMDLTGKETLDRALVPTFIKDLWVSANINSDANHTFRGHAKSTFIAYDKYESDIMIWDGESSEARISIAGLRVTPLDSADSTTSHTRKLCYNIEWKPALELIGPSSFSHVELTTQENTERYRHGIHNFQLATVLQVTDALDELKEFDASSLEGHRAKYYSWMLQLKKWLDADEISIISLEEWKKYSTDPALKSELYRKVGEYNADGTLIIRMGSNISKVLRNEIDPLHLMFGQDDLLDRVYALHSQLGDLPALQDAFFQMINHEATNLNILEVGAGTGSSTMATLKTLTSYSGASGSHIAKYTFTDISAGFFEKAKEKFKEHRDFMEFRTLNAEKDPASQGFELGSYDFVVACNVIHATADLQKTLSNCQRLLKPGGKLILHEGIKQDFLWYGLSFGQLPGWWLAVEPIRQWSPCISATQWDSILKDSGFTGVDLELRDRQDLSLHTQSLLIATALDTASDRHTFWDKTIIVTITPIKDGLSEVVSSLKNLLEHDLKVPNCTVVHYLDLNAEDLRRAVCISVMELEEPVLENATKEGFENIRNMLTSCGGLIWASGDTTSCPGYAMASGLVRTVRWERDIDEVNLITLSVSDPLPSAESLAKSLAKLYQQQFVEHLSPEKMNGEFLLKDEVFMSGRLVDALESNNYLLSKSTRPAPILQRLGDAGRPVKLATAAPGLLNKLEFVTDPIYYLPIGDTEVEIEVKAVGLNFRDLMVAMGEHMAFSMGTEASGIVSRIGSGVEKVKVGDRVVYIGGLDLTGCFHTFGRVDHGVVVKIPESMSFEIAASLPCVYSTVLYSLVDTARLCKGEKILIHAAAGGVGQAAINYSKSIGAEVFATVSSPEKREVSFHKTEN